MYQSSIKNRKGRLDRFSKKRDLELPDPSLGTEFAIVQEMMGNGRVRVLCEDGSQNTARIRGNMRKHRGKVIITRSDLVMVSRRDFDDNLDIIHKYTQEEVIQLTKSGDIPEKIQKSINEGDFCTAGGNEDMVLFCDREDAPQEEEEDPEDDMNIDDI